MRFPKIRRFHFPVLTQTEKSALVVLALVISSGTVLQIWEHSGVKIGPVKDWDTLRKLVLQAKQNANGDTLFPCYDPPAWISEEHWPQRKDTTSEKSSQPRRSGAKKVPPRSPVNLNAADLKTLQSLPKVGPGTAKAIIAYRTLHGRFNTVEDLLEVKGIGPKKFKILKNFIHIL